MCVQGAKGHFGTGFHRVACLLWNSLLDQAGFELTEIHLPLLLSAGIKGMCHHCLAFNYFHVHVYVCTWTPENNCRELVFSFYCVDPKDQMQAIRLGSRHLTLFIGQGCLV